jgi:hypothetical protein
MGGKDAASPRYVFTKLEVSTLSAHHFYKLTAPLLPTASYSLSAIFFFRLSLGASSTPMMTLSSTTLTTMVRLEFHLCVVRSSQAEH